jgi:hypothetical protein
MLRCSTRRAIEKVRFPIVADSLRSKSCRDVAPRVVGRSDHSRESTARAAQARDRRLLGSARSSSDTQGRTVARDGEAFGNGSARPKLNTAEKPCATEARNGKLSLSSIIARTGTAEHKMSASWSHASHLREDVGGEQVGERRGSTAS